MQKSEIYIKTFGGLKPRFDSVKYDKLKIGDEVNVRIWKARNIQLHRYFFALMNLVFDNQDIFVNIDHMREELTIAAGFYEQYENHEGEMKKKAESISFESMDETTFNDYVDKVIAVVVNVWNFDMTELRAEIDNICENRKRA